MPAGDNLRSGGRFTGLAEWRYGNQNARPVTLAGTLRPTRAKPIFPVGKRKHLVSRLMDEMRDWRSTPFEAEADMIHALRAGLCLQGYRWQFAHEEAFLLVGLALRLLGAKRPNWDEGQPQHTESPDRCSWCGRDVDHDGSLTATRYCSQICARSALEKRHFHHRNQTDRSYAAAQRLLSRAKQAPRICVICEDRFQPIRAASTQTCCSYKCAGILRARLKPPPTLAKDAFTITCAYCGGQAAKRSLTALYCSKACCQAHDKEKAGHVPKLLRRHVFDHYITLPVDHRRRTISAQTFDVVFLMAA